MIALIAASAIYMIASQAAVAGQTNAFKDCLKATAAKAKNEKVGVDAYEAYARSACAVQLNGLRDALIAFEMKNGGMSRKSASQDADLTADDYLASSVDKYKFFAGVDTENAAATAAAKAPPAPAATPPATPASAPNPPK
jgi:hypothetical protein